jgi:hypothetical protein
MINILFNSEQLQIICFLLKIEACHTRGFVKVLNLDSGNVNKLLNTLERYGIIKKVSNTEKKSFYHLAKSFNLSDYHFKEAIFYQITSIARYLFSDIDYSLSIPELILNNIMNYRQKVRKSYKQLEYENKKRINVEQKNKCRTKIIRRFKINTRPYKKKRMVEGKNRKIRKKRG